MTSYCQTETQEKFVDKWEGPCEIIDKMSKWTYRVRKKRTDSDHTHKSVKKAVNQSHSSQLKI